MAQYYPGQTGSICFTIWFQNLNITNQVRPEAADRVMRFMKAEWSRYRKGLEKEIQYAVEGYCAGSGYFIRSEYQTEETEGYLNIIQYLTTYFGGVHEEKTRFSYVFDPQGNRVVFQNLFEDVQKAKADIIEKLRKQMKELDAQGYLFKDLDYDKVLRGLVSDEAGSWSLTEDGFHFYIPAYVIAPGSAGDFELFVPYDWRSQAGRDKKD